MNGELLELFNKIDKRIAVLETKFTVHWDTQEKSVDEKHTENRERFKKIFNWLEGLPCKAHKMKIDISWALIVLLLGGVLGMAWRLFK